MLRRALRIALYFLLFVFVMGFLGLGHVAALPFLLAFGWLVYLVRVLPAVSVNWLEIAAWLAVLGALGFGAHGALRSLWRSRQADDSDRGWQPLWSASIVGLLVLLFVANIALVGSVHQLGWILAGTEPIAQSSWRDVRHRSRRLCSEVRHTRRTADELRSALWHDPSLRWQSKDLHVLLRARDDGSVVAAIFPRSPLELGRRGGRLCGDELDVEFEGEELETTLQAYGFVSDPEPPGPTSS